MTLGMSRVAYNQLGISPVYQSIDGLGAKWIKIKPGAPRRLSNNCTKWALREIKKSLVEAQ